MTEHEIVLHDWELGIIAPHYLRVSQFDIYELIMRTKFPFIESARRFGKTNSILAFVMEQLLRHPDWICRWCFPDKNTVREVMAAEIPKMQREAPIHLRFKYQTVDSVWRTPGGSGGIYIRGVNHDRGDSARGPGANIIVADEYGYWDEPQYTIREALFPQLENQEGQWLIKASTPPENLGHIYYIEREEAMRKGRFIQKIITDNEALSKEEHQIIIEESGGINSPAYRRERLCEPVADPKSLVISEWSDELNIVPDDYPRPEFFTPYVAGDSGADDNTAVLFGYHDFMKNEVVIEYEYVRNGKTTQWIVRNAKRIEKALWKLKPYKRWYDASKQLILDIFIEYKWPVTMPDKADKLAAINDLRVEVGARRFKVKKRCKHLARQMKVGMWSNEKHTDFERTEGLGHLDALAAGIYFNRSIDRSLNPWPKNPGVSQYTHFISPEDISRQKNETEQALSQVFGRRTK